MKQENNNLLNLFSTLTRIFNKNEQNSPPPTAPQQPKIKKDKAVIDFIRLHDKRKNEILNKK
jgi:hypothetical protein